MGSFQCPRRLRRTGMKLRLLVVFVLLSTALLVGQTFRGTILGSVTDPSGAVVAGATVKVRNVATGLERTTVTSARRQLLSARIAHRHLLRHRNPDRLPDFCGDRSGSQRGHRTPGGCRPQDRRGIHPSRSLGGRFAHGRDDHRMMLGGVITAQDASRTCPSTAATTPSSSISIPAWPVLPTRFPTPPALSASSP